MAKPITKRVPKIDLLGTASGSASEAASVAEARAFLEGAEAPGSLPEDVADALIEELVKRGDAAKLGLLSLAKDKALSKQARRGVHLLRARGVKADLPAPEPKQFLDAAPKAEVQSLVTPPFRDGETLIWHLQDAEAEEGRLDIYQAHATETDGLVKFELYRASRKQWRDIQRSLAEETRFLFVGVPSWWARWLVEDAYQHGKSLGRSQPREYTEARGMLPPGVAPAVHPAITGVPEEMVVRALRDTGRVLSLPEVESWIPDEAAAKGVYDDIEKLYESPLVLEERVRNARVADAVRTAAATALAGPWRGRIGRRLLDTGYLILRRGENERGSRDYLADAAACVAASREILDETTPPEESHVAQGLFALLIPKKDDAPDPRGSGNLLITP